jgi:hypothetical protein
MLWSDEKRLKQNSNAMGIHLIATDARGRKGPVEKAMSSTIVAIDWRISRIPAWGYARITALLSMIMPMDAQENTKLGKIAWAFGCAAFCWDDDDSFVWLAAFLGPFDSSSSAVPIFLACECGEELLETNLDKTITQRFSQCPK